MLGVLLRGDFFLNLMSEDHHELEKLFTVLSREDLVHRQSCSKMSLMSRLKSALRQKFDPDGLL